LRRFIAPAQLEAPSHVRHSCRGSLGNNRVEKVNVDKLAIVTALSVVLASPIAARAERIRATLIGYEEVPAVSTVASGEFVGMISQDGQSIEYQMTNTGLQGPVTQAHIHVAQPSVNGSIVIWLCQTATNPGPAGTPICTPDSGTFTGTITAANVVAGATASQQLAAGELDEVIAAMRAGVAYANVHTTLSPGGEIRGQISASHRH
jgi:hypothetical protein